MRASAVPQEFVDEAAQAAARRDVARLGLLASEAAGFGWEVEAWRTVGAMLLDIGAWSTARRVLERFRQAEGSEALALREGTATAPLPHVVVFAGHMIDDEGRTPPRFPEACVAAARREIRRCLADLRPSVGIAASASGGDILFHEVCAELGIPTDMRLVLPPEQFVNVSVVKAGRDWAQRFWALVERKQREHRFAQLGENKELPGWLHGKPDYNIWTRANLWLLECALSLEPAHLTVMALWDGQGSDGPGGTAHLVEQATALGATTRVLDTQDICRTPDPAT